MARLGFGSLLVGVAVASLVLVVLTCGRVTDSSVREVRPDRGSQERSAPPVRAAPPRAEDVQIAPRSVVTETASSPSPAAATVEFIVRIRVRDHKDAGIGGAIATLSSGNRVLFEGATAADGRVEGRLGPQPAESRLRIVVRHDGHATATEALELSEGSRRAGSLECAVTLRASATLRGVVLANGADGLSGARVIAWPVRDGSPESERVATQDLRVSGIQSIVTDSAGRFELADVEQATRYALTVQCDGWVCVGGKPAGTMATPGEHDVQLEVRPLYALDLRFLDANGAEPSISRELVALPQSGWTTMPAAILPVPRDDGAAIVAVEPSSWPGPGAPRVFVLFGAYQDSERIGPFVGVMNLPGHRPVRTESWAYRVRRGAWTSQVVRIERIADAVGELVVRWTDAKETPRTEPSTLPTARLVLRPAAGTSGVGSDPFEVRLASFQDCVIRGVPAGTYDVLVSTPLGVAGGIAPPNLQTEVKPGARSVLEIPRLGFGWLEATVSVSDALGERPYSGTLTIDVWKAESGVAGQWSLEHGPYVLGGLAPGRYSARVGAPGHPVSAVLDVDVEEGAVARVQFKLARRP